MHAPVFPYCSPLGHTWGYDGDLTDHVIKFSMVGQLVLEETHNVKKIEPLLDNCLSMVLLKCIFYQYPNRVGKGLLSIPPL